METQKIVNFIFELGVLKRLKHNGWLLAGVKNPETVAEHSLRAAQIGYILAVMEGDANPEKVSSILIIHDNAETRVGDQNKVSAKYYSNKEAEENAFNDQIENLGEEISKRWNNYFSEYEERNTKEGVIAKDADWLEQAFQAKEYIERGYSSAQNWIDNVEKALETESAKLIIKKMKETKSTDWWQGLKKMTYKKLK
ncbi:HD family hydrolase [Candidatus Parcubacteria bacterium]|nr:HD family hydrolase [Candidatus Parcubacteria bacterium]